MQEEGRKHGITRAEKKKFCEDLEGEDGKGKGVGDNSILCVECHRWVHKRCSGISGKLKSNVDFHYRECLEGEHGLFQSDLLKKVVIEPNVKLEWAPKFCYLGDTLGAGGGVEEAARARMRSLRCAWAKFKELSPIPVVPNLVVLDLLKNFTNICAKTANFPILTG